MPNSGEGVLRSGRRLSEEPPEVASSDLPIIPQTIVHTDPTSDETYAPPSGEPSTDAPLTEYSSDPIGLIDAQNAAYAAERLGDIMERKQAATEELLLALRRSPQLCREVLDTVDFVTDGWCKLATKRGNVSFSGLSQLTVIY